MLSGPHTGVLIASPCGVGWGCRQSSVPLSGLNPTTSCATSATTCGWPSTVISIGDE